jgi:hypothetical protein
MFCISKTRADGGKLVAFLDSAGQIYPETGLTFEAPKYVLTSVIIELLVIVTIASVQVKDCFYHILSIYHNYNHAGVN